MRKGIAIGGNWIIDNIKIVDVFPAQDALANIRAESKASGGCAYSTLKDLRKIGSRFPLLGLGLIGKDAAGDMILKDCRVLGINTSQIHRTDKAPTSYTDVMTVAATGRRTFFHNRGANALWDPSHVDLDRITARLFHLGYLLLLDRFDRPDRRYGTVAARFLAQARARGLKTSIDVVSEDSQRFEQIVKPALRHVDTCLLNEFEAGRTTGCVIRRRNGALDPRALEEAAHALLRCGVHERVIIHFPEGAFAMEPGGQAVFQASLRLPSGYIKGTVGAGDAFAAGVLYGVHEAMSLKKTLECGVCVAAASLASPGASDSVRPISSCRALAKKYGFQKSLF